MKKFARIFELEESQVLVTIDMDDKRDKQFQIKITTDFNDVRVTASIRPIKTEEKALEMLESYTKDEAQKFYDELDEMVNS